MSHSKNFVLDTNAILEDENIFEILRNGKDGKDINEIYIPRIVLEELDGLKKSNRVRPRVFRSLYAIQKFKDILHVIGDYSSHLKPDNHILQTIKESNIENPILITNDILLQFKAFNEGIECQEFKSGKPFQSESETYTGFSDPEKGHITNSFFWKEGKPFFWNGKDERCIQFEHNIWNIKPKDIYQNLAFDLMINENIPLVTIQSKAGVGKSLLSLASALYLTRQLKKYSKIYVIKSNWEIGKELGFRPGSVEEKMEPIWKPVKMLLYKLHDIRKADRLFMNPDHDVPAFNTRVIEFLPMNFLRGMTIEDSVVIVDELQNMSRDECRTLFSRMGENVKCICTGDTNQVDSPHLNKDNNGLNWTVKKFKGDSRYAHLVINSKKSRGPICELVSEKDL